MMSDRLMMMTAVAVVVIIITVVVVIILLTLTQLFLLNSLLQMNFSMSFLLIGSRKFSSTRVTTERLLTSVCTNVRR